MSEKFHQVSQELNTSTQELLVTLKGMELVKNLITHLGGNPRIVTTSLEASRAKIEIRKRLADQKNAGGDTIMQMQIKALRAETQLLKRKIELDLPGDHKAELQVKTSELNALENVNEPHDSSEQGQFDQEIADIEEKIEDVNKKIQNVAENIANKYNVSVDKVKDLILAL